MATSLPTELVREFGVLAPRQSQLWAIGSTAPAASTFLEALDWMLAIIWPFAYDEPFQLSAFEAPSEVSRRTDTLRELSNTHPRVEVVAGPDLFGRGIAAAADALDENTSRLLLFEITALQLAGRDVNDEATRLRPERFTWFLSTVKRVIAQLSRTSGRVRHAGRCQGPDQNLVGP